jgi:predicted RNA-binding protein associated with RNAse of E/G family
MKRKRADRIDWARITKKRFAMTYIDDGAFKGYVSLFCIDEVNAPLFRYQTCLADNGYKWLQHFPAGAQYAVSTIFNEQNEIVRWYIDICNRHYLDTDGVLYYEDLYLDVDVAPNGDATLLDVDELDEALHAGLVSSLEYEIAWREAEKLMHAIENNMFPLLWQSAEHEEKVYALIERQ